MNRLEELKREYVLKFGVELKTIEDSNIELEKVNKLIEQEELRLKEENDFKWYDYE